MVGNADINVAAGLKWEGGVADEEVCLSLFRSLVEICSLQMIRNEPGLDVYLQNSIVWQNPRNVIREMFIYAFVSIFVSPSKGF